MVAASRSGASTVDAVVADDILPRMHNYAELAARTHLRKLGLPASQPGAPDQ